MSVFYRHLIRPVLFRQDSEVIHDRVMAQLHWASQTSWARQFLRLLYDAEELPVRLFGLDFPNPVGLAAGMDKRGVAVPAWACMGFGFSELGGVTWHAQPGNEKPRMFRAIADEALVNRMGFNNGGAEAMAVSLQRWREAGVWPAHPVGINLGKSKITPLPEAPTDYANSFRALWHLADFFVVNVSSPNTPNLRKLQDRAALDEILAAMQEVNRALATSEQSAKPVLVKVAPDLSWEALDEIVELAGPRALSGIVATNTTISRPETAEANSRRAYAETGGLSGRPLRQRSTEVVRHLYRQTNGKLPIIGVGGIFNSTDAWEKIAAGASLVQVYSGLVYEGPGLIRQIVRGLVDTMKERGISNYNEIVGSEAGRSGTP